MQEIKGSIDSSKTAIIYCRAAKKQDAKRQQMTAENKAKELNAVVKAVFIDIIPAQRQTLLQRILYIFRGNQPRKAARRKEWSKAIAYLKAHKTDYAITETLDRLSRNYVELLGIVGTVNDFGTRVAFSDFDSEEDVFGESFLKQTV